MVRLSVNINKIATLRNARGGDVPDVVQAARDIERFGAQGITVHPRPDERHIRYEDVRNLRPCVNTEFNIEGYPTASFIDLVAAVVPDQVTLVPDPPEVLTSNAGWDTKANKSLLSAVIKTFSDMGIRTSLFIECDSSMIQGAAACGADRVELYTESYAKGYTENREKAIEPFLRAAEAATQCNLGINAGHDLNRSNLCYFAEQVEGLLEVSIGHALISDALYYGLENSVQLYLRELRVKE